MKKYSQKGFIRLNFSKKNLGGFTLIELLVVIAVIGILSSIVLVSLSGARAKAADTRVISSMDQFRTQAIILSDIHGNYDNVECTLITDTTCTCDDGSITTLCKDVVKNDNQTANDNLIVRVGNAKTTYCAYVHLKGSGKYWCVDHNLISKGDYTTAPAACTANCLALDDCKCE